MVFAAVAVLVEDFGAVVVASDPVLEAVVSHQVDLLEEQVHDEQ